MQSANIRFFCDMRKFFFSLFSLRIRFRKKVLFTVIFFRQFENKIVSLQKSCNTTTSYESILKLQ